MESTIIVIPAEGDSAGTEQWYIEALKTYYLETRGIKLRVLVFDHLRDAVAVQRDIYTNTLLAVRQFFCENDFCNAEVHAQGGLGAYVGCMFLNYCPARIRRVVMIGGAPCQAMTVIAKLFHRVLVRWWYHFGWLIPFFADDPNPEHDPIITEIKESSTRTMRENPTVYCKQLVEIGYWTLPENWRVPEGCEVYFVPNGDTKRPKFWDNTYNDTKAKLIWQKHGGVILARPGNYFSFYSMMPAKELFFVLDTVR